MYRTITKIIILNMTIFMMELKDFKEYFNEKTKIKDEEDFIILEIEGFKSKNDNECEYSIKWINQNDEEEKGIIKNINTSSPFSFMSCSWSDA